MLSKGQHKQFINLYSNSIYMTSMVSLIYLNLSSLFLLSSNSDDYIITILITYYIRSMKYHTKAYGITIIILITIDKSISPISINHLLTYISLYQFTNITIIFISFIRQACLYWLRLDLYNMILQ